MKINRNPKDGKKFLLGQLKTAIVRVRHEKNLGAWVFRE
jgi:hypothetical protein